MPQTHEAFPESLALIDDDRALQITWDDGRVQTIRLNALRAACACAVCKGHDPSQSLNLTPDQFPDIRLTDLAPVGRYAYHLVWSDGHDTGIYTIRMLREMGG